MASSLPLQVAETIQTASLNRAPSPTHDLNPSTTASAKEPVSLEKEGQTFPPSRPLPLSAPQGTQHPITDKRKGHKAHQGHHARSESETSIPYSTIHPLPRKSTLPPLPDLRFEQSYLASLRDPTKSGEIYADWRTVAYITVRDQVFMPLLQGTLWTLLVVGWRVWNRGASVGGASLGGRLRRWWWEVNDWEVPGEAKLATGKKAEVSGGFTDWLRGVWGRRTGQVGERTASDGLLWPRKGDEGFAGEVGEYYTGQFGSAGGD